nr:radical SAM family heme chaperone HemW [uncultured Desulfuromonas sp.]
MSGLYFHIPFCRHKCPYCDFYSLVGRECDLDDYVEALCQDLAFSREWFGDSCFSTVFFGGGTPSLLSPSQVNSLLECAQHHFSFTPDVEISMEVNPGTVDRMALQGYRNAGVNRLSLGLQSFDDGQLNWLQRIHSVRQGVETVENARLAGFERLNVDLMFALPGQSQTDLIESCRRLAELNPEHVAIYGLSVEQGTPLAQWEQGGSWCQIEEEDYRRQYLLLSEQLQQDGFNHYEISNFCREGEECRHNLGYWQRKPYLGVGAGAHSFVDRGHGERWHCPDDLDDYFRAIHAGENARTLIETFSREQALSEAVYLALRCQQGIDDAAFLERYGVRFSACFSEAISDSKEALHRCGERYYFLPKDWLLYDYHIEKFLF